MPWIAKFSHPNGGINMFATSDRKKLDSWIAQMTEKFPDGLLTAEEFEDAEDQAILAELDKL